jgi:hypothetical protein
MKFQGEAQAEGHLGLKVIRRGEFSRSAVPARELTPLEIVKYGMPNRHVPEPVARWRAANLRNLMRGASRVLAARALGLPHFFGQLSLVVLKEDGRMLDLGLASMRVVTDVGVGYIVDAFQNIVELENMKFHGFGTGTTNEAAGDTALVTELTTQYATDNTRPTGTTTEGATANIYRTVATLSPDSGGTIAITEHGVFHQAANSGGTLLDRSKFAAVNLVAGSDSLQATYDFTLTSGS